MILATALKKETSCQILPNFSTEVKGNKQTDSRLFLENLQLIVLLRNLVAFIYQTEVFLIHGELQFRIFYASYHMIYMTTHK
jgi:hypothetical protein